MKEPRTLLRLLRRKNEACQKSDVLVPNQQGPQNLAHTHCLVDQTSIYVNYIPELDDPCPSSVEISWGRVWLIVGNHCRRMQVKYGLNAFFTDVNTHGPSAYRDIWNDCTWKDFNMCVCVCVRLCACVCLSLCINWCAHVHSHRHIYLDLPRIKDRFQHDVSNAKKISWILWTSDILTAGMGGNSLGIYRTVHHGKP